jgi:hypothetical protein
MNVMINAVKNYGRMLSFLAILFITIPAFAQKTAVPQLEKMPVSLETDFALSSLPPQLRPGATIYLLDPAKGYYIARKGTNGFICFVMRTAWEWAEFRNDIYTAISYDAEGARTIFPVYLYTAAMRAGGKLTALQVRNNIIDKIKKGIYTAPARPGISYMLGPMMRTYPGTPASNKVLTMKMPHYMFYAPYMTNTDIGNIPNGEADGPMLVHPESLFLGEKKAPYGYIIVPAGEKERATIIAENKDLLKRLGDYRAFLK